ncbi:MAG TPA: UvrD-helicase domain-containing protein [Gammaproteobacteria bacterium]
MSINAANPAINATVTASAGSGKTWMLVTRILRILLEDAQPGSILALTFTRKAAGEMQQRLAERLHELATVSEAKLDKGLHEIGITPDDTYRQRARSLYEFHQYCDYPVRTQTFHSFCQDILARFPLEADVPPGFDLLESSSLLIKQAMDALYNEAALNMNGKLAQDLQQFMSLCDGQFNLDKALHSFLDHRSDWWAFTEAADEPVGFATNTLQQQLEFDANIDPLQNFFNVSTLQYIKEFASLLGRYVNKTNEKHANSLADVLLATDFNAKLFQQVCDCFLKKDGDPLKQGREDKPTVRKALGDDTDRFLELNELIVSAIFKTKDLLNKQNTFELNRLWYICGEHFVSHYQKLKRELRILDFTDLEWRTYKLLQSSDNALWVQYKLDQRIDHLLIDEFQDTNPTQWQLILPLLQEMAAAETSRMRSVFLVGDEKQSIYSFRRAKPELQAQASSWLAENLTATAFPLNKSWRSSPAIIESVNEIFKQDDLKKYLPTFPQHQTHQQDLAGKVVVLPLLKQIQDEEEEEQTGELRNPLKQPRAEKTGMHYQEGQLIAQHIQQLVNDRISLGHEQNQRTIEYGDVFILVRNRSHVADYEKALRQAGIPYLGANKGTFLDCMEIQDMEALLDSIMTPFNNLALAQVLKSPIFSASDEDLMRIASVKTDSGLWIDRIDILHDELEADHPIHRAHVALTRWRELADKIPVHDLLDKIYNEANVLKRYEASAPDALKPRVVANLTRFLELALELDSGRYPSLMHFLDYLRSLRMISSDAPDEAPMETEASRVRIMTIHASKGLEAPVIFLADTMSVARDRYSMSTLVDWPAEKARPVAFQLIPQKDLRDSLSQQRLQQSDYIEQRENVHLLYVALTRAKQLLYVSACQPERGSGNDWYTPIHNAVSNIGNTEDDGTVEYCKGTFTQHAETSTTEIINNAVKFDPRLSKAFSNLPKPDRIIAPSRTASTTTAEADEDAQQRGIAIHRCLDLLSRSSPYTVDSIKQLLASELDMNKDDTTLEDYLEEAQGIINNPAFTHLFKLEADSKSFNETPIHYMLDNRMVFGVIDRMILRKNEITIIDYKSHQHATQDNLYELAQHYKEQMRLYAEGVRRAWPDKKINAALLFTHCAGLQEVLVD